MTARRIANLSAALLLALGSVGQAQEPEAVLRIKAAFVLNFLKFVEWPEESAQTDLPLAVVGESPLAAALQTALSDQEVQGRTVNVRAYPSAAAWRRDGAAADQAVFFLPATVANWPDLRNELKKRPVLTISESPGFCASGGMLNLFEQDGRIKFEANPEAARAAGLMLRAELLKLAKLVKTE